MANDTLPLVFHTERHGPLICTREEAGAVRVKVLRVVTLKTTWQRRILSKTRGRQRALSESSLRARGWRQTSAGFCYRPQRRSVTRCTQRQYRPQRRRMRNLHTLSTLMKASYPVSIYSFLKPLKVLTQIRETVPHLNSVPG